MLVLEKAWFWIIVPRHVLRGQVWVFTGSLCFQLFNQTVFSFQNIFKYSNYFLVCSIFYQFNVVVILASLPPSYLLFIHLVLLLITVYFQGCLIWKLIPLTHHAHPVACYSSICTIIPGGTLLHFYIFSLVHMSTVDKNIHQRRLYPYLYSYHHPYHHDDHIFQSPVLIALLAVAIKITNVAKSIHHLYVSFSKS